MHVTPSRLRVSFQARVLAPVVAIIVLLTAATIWVVNHRISAQLQFQAEQQLDTADKVFRQVGKIRADQLLSRYRNVSNEPRLKALVTRTDSQTTIEALKTMFDEDPDAQVFIVLSADGKPGAAAARHPALDAARFEMDTLHSIRQSLDGVGRVEAIQSGGKLYDVVSVPIREGSDIVGVMAVAVETDVEAAQQIKSLAHSDVLFVVDHSVAASSLKSPASYPTLTSLFEKLSSAGDGGSVETVLNGEHFLCKAGSFGPPGGGSGYLLLSSCEMPRQVLLYTQQMLLGVGLLGIFISSVVVWLLVRRITQPLRLLRNNVEAVGRGDFSRRVPITSNDECGDLASAFNQMTDHLKTSRAELEETVETLRSGQHQLIESEKLAGIGEFVAGVAHELNNPLTSVMGFAELLQQDELAEPQRRLLDMIAKSARRCTKIVQSLLSFARRHAPERKVLSVNEIVESAAEILQYQMRTSNIEVLLQLDPRLPATLLDPHQMQQVFLNIINNAKQAMEADHKGGSLRISTLTAGERVRIVFQDSGPGIPEENLKKVFNPFFTTREVGKGTGLGLSLCYGIVTEHGGAISVQSHPGMGATFTIELPITREAAAARAENALAPAPARNPHEGVGKSVLVIDDEDSILQMIQQALTLSGYKVDIARDGEAALRRLGQYHYDLALCDWKMPGLTGQEVYERLRAANPDMSRRLIFITGDTLNATTQEFLKSSDKICLSKPFTLAEFRAAIGRLLSPPHLN